MNKCHLESVNTDWSRSNMLTNRFLMVERVIGEGIGQRRVSGPYRRKKQSIKAKGRGREGVKSQREGGREGGRKGGRKGEIEL